MRRGRRKVEIRGERMSRYPSHMSFSFLFVFLLIHYGKFASLSSAQSSLSTRMALGIENMSDGTSFDDDANFHRNYVLKHATMQRRVQATATPKYDGTSKPVYPIVSVENQESLNQSSHQGELAANGDLLAIESNDISQLLAQHQHVRSPPYAAQEQLINTNHSILSDPIQPVQPKQHLDDGQLLKLHRTPASVPIYLRHPLPSTVTRPQIIAFEHPASLRKQVGSVSRNQDGYAVNNQRASSGATFALLPSWPKIYIAQREQPLIGKQNDTNLSQLDPKVPSIYPNWSTHNVSDEPAQIDASVSVAQQQHSESDQLAGERIKKPTSFYLTPGKVNSTSSEVEYEESPTDRKSTAYSRMSNETTNWAKLLRQAAKSDVMESLMLSNKSIVSLLCDADNMLVRFKFRQPFHGLVETNLDPNEQCRLYGNGSQYYEMRVDLYGCGTRQEMPRLFINNLQIQYQNPFLLIQSRLQLLHKQQQTASSDQSADVEELKTIICSYPIQPRVLTPSRGQVDLNPNDLNHTNETSSDLFKQGPATNVSDRIIEVPGQDVQDSARLFYYEPVLLISGLILLAIACTLALVTSAFLMRRRHQKLSSRSSSTIRSSSQLSPAGESDVSLMRIYNRSPAQVAHQQSLIAPPLIGLSKEESLCVRPSIKQYPPTSTIALREKQRESRTPTTKKDHGRRWTLSENQQQPNQLSTATDTGDSLDSQTRGDQSSVTTIEIPYVGHSRPPILLSPSVRASGKRKFGRDEASQADLGGKSGRSSYSEYKQIKRHEKIIETKYYEKPSEVKDVPKTDRVASSEQKAQSPVPFGSFRSKLTSPREFKRLQNIKRLFEESRGNHDPTSSLSRLKMRICRTLSEAERLKLIEMLANDEVFRSYILDSVDRQTFSRKLRNNSNYSDKFSSSTWKLFEEILLNIALDELITGQERPKTTYGPTLGSDRVPLKDQKLPTSKHSNLKPSTTLSDAANRRDKLVIASATEPLDSRHKEDDCSDNYNGPVHISQYNAGSIERVPRDTILDVNSITTISSPRNETAYSSSFEQTTRYKETHHAIDDSLPYMDDFSQGSIASQSSSSLEHRHRK